MKKFLFTALLLGLVLSCTDQPPKPIDTELKRSGGAFSYAHLDVQPTTFVINNQRDTFLCSKNNLIYVPAQAFITKDQTSQVELYLKEYTQPGECLTQNIATTTINQQLLLSSTILHLEARQGPDPVKLAPDQQLRVHILRHADQADETMTLWGGTPEAWRPVPFDRPRLFNHRLKIGSYRARHFANGHSIDAWEKQHLSISPEEEQVLWNDRPSLHLYFTINPNGKIEQVSFKEPITNDFQRRILQEMADYPQCRPHLVNGVTQSIQCEYVFRVRQTDPKYREDLDYLNAITRNKAALAPRVPNHIDNLELKYHIFNIQKLGWLAAAKAQTVEKTADLVVQVAPDVSAQVKVLLQDSKAIVLGTVQENGVVFRGLPQNKDIQIIAFGHRANQPVYAEAQANSSDGIVQTLPFEPTSTEGMRHAIRQVGHTQ